MKSVNQLKLKHLEKKKSRLYKKLQRINDSILRIEFNDGDTHCDNRDTNILLSGLVYADTDSYKQILNSYYGKKVIK